MADIRTLDLNLLRVLDAVLDERSVTRAAARLALTQPTVSGMLARLRASLDDPLFVRTQRGVVPTPRALELAVPVKRVLGEVESLLKPSTFHPASAEGTLTVAATDYALSVIVVPFVAALRGKAPNIRVAVRPIHDDLIEGQLARGEVDFALTTPEAAPPDLHGRRLWDERYVCALRDDHPAWAGGRLSLDRFCGLDHVLVSYAGGGFRGATDDALERVGRRRRVVVSVMSFLALHELLRSSDLVAVVPSRLMTGVNGLAVAEPPLDIPGFTMLAAWHERTHRGAAHVWARGLLADAASMPSSGLGSSAAA